MNFYFYRKNIYLFVNIYIVPFRVIPLRYITLLAKLFLIPKALLMSTFWYRLGLFQRCSFYLLNRSKFSSFHGSLQFWKQEKTVAGAKSGEYGVVIGKKITNKMTCELPHYQSTARFQVQMSQDRGGQLSSQ